MNKKYIDVIKFAICLIVMALWGIGLGIMINQNKCEEVVISE